MKKVTTALVGVVGLLLVALLTACNNSGEANLLDRATTSRVEELSDQSQFRLSPTPGPYIGTLPTNPLIVFVGGSYTAGPGLPKGLNYPSQTVQLLSPARYDYFNEGVEGDSLAKMLEVASWSIDPYYRSSRSKNIVVVWAGQEDLAKGGSAEEVYQNLVNYSKERQAVGFRVIILTLLPAGLMPDNDNYEAKRVTLNANLRNNWQEFAYGLADVAVAPNLVGSNGKAKISSYYQEDGKHLKAAGYKAVAEIVKKVL